MPFGLSLPGSSTSVLLKKLTQSAYRAESSTTDQQSSSVAPLATPLPTTAMSNCLCSLDIQACSHAVAPEGTAFLLGDAVVSS